MDVLNKKYLTLNGENEFYMKDIGVVGDTNSRGFRLKINNDVGENAKVSLICKINDQTYIKLAEKERDEFIVKFPNAAFLKEGTISYSIRVEDEEGIVQSKIMKARVSESIISSDYSDDESYNIDFEKLNELSNLDLDSLKNIGSSVDENILNEKINEKVGDLSEYKDVIEKDNISVLDVLSFYVNMLTQRIAQTDDLIERSDLPVINFLLEDLSSKVSSLESQKTHNIWTGTQDEFNEIESKDDKTIYMVVQND